MKEALGRHRSVSPSFSSLALAVVVLGIGGCGSPAGTGGGVASRQADGPAAAQQPSTSVGGMVARKQTTPEKPVASPPAEQQGAAGELPAEASVSDQSQRAEPPARQNPLRTGKEPAPGLRPAGTRPAATEGAQSGEDEAAEPPFDPIKENGPVFVDWPPPKLALVVTGRQDGYLEPCGCAGLERMKGGLGRRLSMFEDLRHTRGWTVVGLDVGGLVKGFGPQANLKFQTTVNAMKEMRYDVIAPGTTDVQSGVDNLISAGTGQESPFVSANVALFGFDAGLTAPKRIIEAGGMKLGVTSVLGETWQRQINNPDVALAKPAEKLAPLVAELEPQCDKLVLLAHATLEETLDLARQFPQFDVVVTAGGPPEPPEKAQRLGAPGRVLVEVGEKAMYAVVLGFYDDPNQPIRDQRVPLDSRYPQSDRIKKLMGQYEEGLKDLGLEGLGIKPISYPGKELMGRFVGSAKCQSCHEESYKVWKKSGHAKAWETLVGLDPPRNFDPECISCHVVGWSPQNFRPFQSGFLSEKETPHLVDVGCETCHGPGEKHCEAEMGADLALQEKLRQAAVITLEESQAAVSTAIVDRQPCMNCHDLDNSPAFRFDTYWPKIEHAEDVPR